MNPVVVGVALVLAFYVGGVYFFHSTVSSRVAYLTHTGEMASEHVSQSANLTPAPSILSFVCHESGHASHCIISFSLLTHEPPTTTPQRSAEVAGVGSTVLSVEAPHEPTLQQTRDAVVSKHAHGRGRRANGTAGEAGSTTVSVWSAAEVSLDARTRAAEALVRRVVGEKSAQACATTFL